MVEQGLLATVSAIKDLIALTGRTGYCLSRLLRKSENNSCKEECIRLSSRLQLFLIVTRFLIESGFTLCSKLSNTSIDKSDITVENVENLVNSTFLRSKV
jgi:hypothetical protein